MTILYVPRNVEINGNFLEYPFKANFKYNRQCVICGDKGIDMSAAYSAN